MDPILIIALFLCLLYLLHRRKRGTNLPLPPGPKGHFLIGNILDLPKGYEWLTYAKWAKTHGPLLYLNLVGQPLIVINSWSVAEDLLERRSAIYSDRPRLPMICEQMGWDFSVIFMKYGPTWRNHRRIIHQSFNNSAVAKYHPHFLKAAHNLMRNLLEKPENFRYYLKHMAAEVILSVAYGIQIQSDDDPYVEIAERALNNLTKHGPTARHLVNAVPWLQHLPDWMPFTHFKEVGRECKKYTTDMVEVPYRAVRDDILAGNSPPSLVADGLLNPDDTSDFAQWEDTVKRVAGTAYAGGSDTTGVSLMNGILALMCHPEVLKKAQAEIDSVVKPGNLPEFSDREPLPYLTAILKEIWRWSPITPLGSAHFIETEDVYNGCRIPAKSIVSANIWGMLHDEAVYPDPFSFNPDRFMKDGKLNPDIPDPVTISFGFGRRACPGQNFATLSIWMALTCIVTLFDISKPIDENGNVIEPALKWTSNSVPEPLPFKCKIVPRSELAIAAILRTREYDYFNE